MRALVAILALVALMSRRSTHAYSDAMTLSPPTGSVLSIHADETPGLPPLPAQGGVREEEAVAMLRLFYAQENQSAPVPQKRTRRQLELAESAAAAVRAGGCASAAASSSAECR